MIIIFIIIGIITLVALFVLVFLCGAIYGCSDFGESVDTLTDEEYNETCKAYNEYYKERSRMEGKI